MGLEKKILYAMQAFIITFAFIYITSVTFLPMPSTGVDHSKTIIGFILGTVLGTILAYNWGTSKGSADQREATEKRLNANAGLPPEGSPLTGTKKEEKGGAV